MELNQLEYFYETAKREHITQTAEALNITQPALSKAIARLESDLGVKLFDREGKNISLNECGQVALRYTEQLLYLLGDMRAELAELAQGRAGRIRIGTSFPSQEPNWLLESVRAFALARPDVSFKITQLSSWQMQSALTEQEIDIAVSTTPLRSTELIWDELFVEPMGVILSADHPLAARESLSLLDLRKERFYCNNANSDVQDLTIQFCRQAGFEPIIHFEGEFASFIGEAVALGYGISVISLRGYGQSHGRLGHEAWERKITYRPLKEPYCRRVCGLARLGSRHQSSAVREFYQYLVDKGRKSYSWSSK